MAWHGYKVNFYKVNFKDTFRAITGHEVLAPIVLEMSLHLVGDTAGIMLAVSTDFPGSQLRPSGPDSTHKILFKFHCGVELNL